MALKTQSHFTRTVQRIDENTAVDSYEKFMEVGRKTLRGVYKINGEDIDDSMVDGHLVQIYNTYSPNYVAMLVALKNAVRSEGTVQQDVDNTVIEIIEALITNPTNRSIYRKLDEALSSSPAFTCNSIMRHASPYVKTADLNEAFDESIFGAGGAPMVRGVVKTPQHALDLLESLYDMSMYAAKHLNRADKTTYNTHTIFLESLRNVYKTYKRNLLEYVEATNTADDMFMMFVSTPQPLYYFTPQKLSTTINNIDYFMWLLLKFFDKFIDMNESMIVSLFGAEKIHFAKTLSSRYAKHCKIVEMRNWDIADQYVTYSKLYEAMNVLVNLNQCVDAGASGIVVQYIKQVKPMVDTLRTYLTKMA